MAPIFPPLELANQYTTDSIKLDILTCHEVGCVCVCVCVGRGGGKGVVLIVQECYYSEMKTVDWRGTVSLPFAVTRGICLVYRSIVSRYEVMPFFFSVINTTYNFKISHVELDHKILFVQSKFSKICSEYFQFQIFGKLHRCKLVVTAESEEAKNFSSEVVDKTAFFQNDNLRN